MVEQRKYERIRAAGCVRRSVCCQGRGWRIGCAFDRPTAEKQRALRALVWERRKLVRS
jgi:hypothetical protein